jgi:hypothetical protein
MWGHIKKPVESEDLVKLDYCEVLKGRKIG